MSNAPRYRLVGYDIGTAPDENGGWVHWTDHEAIVARLTAERDAALTKAWIMGREDAAGAAKHAGLAFGYERAVQAIRALTPPADLAAKIGGAE